MLNFLKKFYFFEKVYFYFLKVTDESQSADGPITGQPGGSSGQPIVQVSTPTGNGSSIVFIKQ